MFVCLLVADILANNNISLPRECAWNAVDHTHNAGPP